MAAKKKSSTRKKPQYVRAKRKGADGSLMARRSVTIGLMVFIVAAIVFGVIQGIQAIEQGLFSENPRFELQHLEISSDGKLSEDRVREYMGVSEGTNLWAFTFADIESNLGKVPIIESVDLSRVLNGTLIVKVKERVPVARILGRQSRRFPFIVDRHQFILPPRTSASSLPLIQGLDVELKLGEAMEHEDLEKALKVIAMCDSDPYLRSYIALETVDVKHSDFILLHFNKGTRAKISRHSLQQRLYKVAGTIKVESGRGLRVKTVDATLDSINVPVTYY